MRALWMASPFLALALWGVASRATSQSGSDARKSFPVAGFDAVSLDGSDDVRVVRGATASVTASGRQAVIDKLDIRVVGTTLKIGRKSSGWSMGWNGNQGAQITVTVPRIRAVAVAGSGDMTVDQVDGDALNAAVSGSGNLDLASVRAKAVDFAVSGSGNLKASGTSQTANMRVNGSGDVDAKNLSSQQATISVGGSGNLSTTVTGSATIAVGGSGDVDVRGTDRCAINKSGSGEARCSR